MSVRSRDSCFRFTLSAEGGFVDNPDDPGGATNKGVTLATLTAWRTQEGLDPPTVDDLRALSDDEAMAIWGANYWNKVRGDDLPAGVDLMVSDFGFNAGTKRSAVLLQQALGLHGGDVDGWIGPQTLGMLSGLSAFRLIADLATRQALYYRSLAGFATFGHGWINRTDHRRASAVALSNAFGAPPAPSPDTSADALNAAELASHTQPETSA